MTLTRRATEPITTVRDDAVTALLSGWLMAGLMLDGWAHTTRGGVESFFTPWHAAFYSGFLATAAWIAYLITRSRPSSGAWGVPVGYRLAVTGLVVFAAGGVLDMIWHMLLGVEANIDALVSPTHSLLLAGAMLVVSAPIRSGWHRPTPRVSPWRWLWPALLATGLCALLAQFFVFYGAGWQEPAFRFPWQPGADDFLVGFSLLGLLASTAIFMVASLLVLIRWSPPFGAFAMILGIVGLGLQGISGFARPGEFLGAVVAGFLVDGVNRRLIPSPAAPRTLRTFAVIAPMVVWGTHAAYLAIVGELRWPPVLWGAIALQGLVGLALSVLALPPRLPEASH